MHSASEDYYIYYLDTDLLVNYRKTPKLHWHNGKKMSLGTQFIIQPYPESGPHFHVPEYHLCSRQENGKRIKNNRIKVLLSISLGDFCSCHTDSIYTPLTAVHLQTPPQ